MDSRGINEALRVAAQALEGHDEPLDALQDALMQVTRADVVQILDEIWDQAPEPETAASTISRPVRRHGRQVGTVVIGWRVPYVPDGGLLALIDVLAAAAGHALERRRLLAEAAQAARTDPLTGLANRREWDDRVPLEIERALRDHLPLAIAMLDLDLFKPYNDTFGHQAGDQALIQVAQLLSAGVRRGDIVGRLGGDEFGILLEQASGASAHETAARLGDQIADCEFLHDGDALPLSVAIGVAMIDGQASPAEVMAQADEEMYRRKAAA